MGATQNGQLFCSAEYILGEADRENHWKPILPGKEINIGREFESTGGNSEPTSESENN
jgi:hypothetical protein